MTPAPRYPKPKILLLDMPASCATVLTAAGYNASAGTFGTPSRVTASDSFYPVTLVSTSIPNMQEQELVIANIGCTPSTESCTNEYPGDGVKALWQRATEGDIDPRPYAMAQCRKYFHRVQAGGGVFIALVASRYACDYYTGTAHGSARHHQVEVTGTFQTTNWSCLHDLESCEVENVRGEEIIFDQRATALAALLARGSAGAEYSCAIAPHYKYQACWTPLATNKYGQCVAGLLAHGDPRHFVLLLPQMPAFDKILVELVENWCSLWSPSLFPDLEGARWVHRKKYEIPEVLVLAEQIETTEEKAKAQVAALAGQIERVRADRAEWYTLLNGTGDALVAAVIKTLGKLGFKQVVDVDAESRSKGLGTNLREDIQIHDQIPILIVDVKGINSPPDDDESRQAEKHAIMRMREWKRTDVQPLTIINHQRHLPPDGRDIVAYRKEIIANAADTGLGLMTTWDLFRILRNAETLGWSPAAVLPIFYRQGRIEPIPEHYRGVGTMDKLWKSAFRLIPTEEVRAGVRLAIEVGDRFVEIVADSLQNDGKAVTQSLAGTPCGVGCADADKLFREGMRVFLVESIA